MTPATGHAPGALEQLATALGPEFSTTLVIGADRRPRLSVTCRDTRASGEVYADDSGWIRWPWAEPLADNPLAAACQITAVLRGIAPSGGQQ